jgi:pimeloyl-ACP methyl ester carboxylesterase
MNAKDWYETANNFVFNDLNIVYKRQGRGPNLLCIHGFPTSSFDFEPLWLKLTSKFHVIAPDLIGLGKSSKPKLNLTVRLQADIIESLLIDLKKLKVHILAHDLGDTVAQELLARQLEGRIRFEIQSCTFLNGGLFPETHKPRFIQQLLISPLGPLVARLSSKRTFVKNMNSIFGRKNPPEKDFLNDSWDLITENGGKLMLPKLIRYMKEREENRERKSRCLM